MIGNVPTRLDLDEDGIAERPEQHMLLSDLEKVDVHTAGTSTRRAATIWDIAREANVSKTTVSRVLNGSDKVAAPTRDRVARAIAKLDFQVNLAARSLRTARTALVGFLVPTIDNEVFGKIAQRLDTELSGSGVGLVIGTSGWDAEAELKALRAFHSRGVDGLVLSLVDDQSPEVAEFVRSFDRPIVLLDREVAGFETDAVLTDQWPGISASVTHLYELGHRRLGLATISGSTRPGREGMAAFEHTSKELGLSSTKFIVRDVSLAAGRAAASELFAADVSAIVACTPSLVLAGIIEQLDGRGLSIPEDVSLIGYDESELAFAKRPKLTVVSRQLDEIAHYASSLIVDRLADPDTPHRIEVVRTMLQVRESTAPFTTP